MEKFIKDGKVAVLYSPGHGAGWFTSNEENPELIFDPEIVKMVLDNKKEKIYGYLNEKYKEEYICALGVDDLKVEWLPIGTRFKIDEYDGSESIETLDNFYFVA